MVERLIDAEALKHKRIIAVYGNLEQGLEEREVVYVEDIDNAPVIEAKPVAHAHWEKEFFTNYRQRVCSVCFATVRQTLYDDGEPRLFNYCPWCGAQMDEKENDND